MESPGTTAANPRPFRVSKLPTVASKPAAGTGPEQVLPRSYGAPIIFAIARDPKSLFVYWDINWALAFGKASPNEREVFLRVYDKDDTEVHRLRVEALANNGDVSLTGAGSAFRVELGYFDRDQVWHGLASSEPTKMPADKVGAIQPGDFALVPFHVTFQRLTEMFRGGRHAEESLTESLAQFEQRAADPVRYGGLDPTEKEIYRAMKAGIPQSEDRPRALDPAGEKRLQRKLESIIGFGASSPANSFPGSSRAR
jgi:Domain of unknown function (DUF4912)